MQIWSISEMYKIFNLLEYSHVSLGYVGFTPPRYIGSVLAPPQLGYFHPLISQVMRPG
jgi:hypothetical protein